MKKQIFMLSTLIIMSCSNDDATNETDPENTAPIADNRKMSVDEYLTSDLITTIEASDNENDALVYSITSQTPTDAILINETNGEIYVQDVNAFDFERNDEIIANINISDGDLTTTMELIITINDVPGPEGKLLAYYPFNNSMDDYSGNNNHVSNSSSSGLTVIPNRFGKPDSAMEFNEGFMSIPSFGTDELNFSISVWVYKDMSLSPMWDNTIISKAGAGRDYVLKFEGDEINAHYFRDGTYYHNTTQEDLTFNKWTNVVLKVENGINWSVYINGELKVSNPNATSNIWTNNSIVIGALEESGGEYFKGKIDDILVYNRALADFEIYEIANNRY